MEISQVTQTITEAQGALYKVDCRKENNCLGRTTIVPIVLTDFVLEPIKWVALIVESVAQFLINLVGAAFFDSCTLEDAGKGFCKMICGVAMGTAFFAASPIVLIYGIFKGLYKPAEAKPLIKYVKDALKQCQECCSSGPERRNA